jgi:hypothetical protein
MTLAELQQHFKREPEPHVKDELATVGAYALLMAQAQRDHASNEAEVRRGNAGMGALSATGPDRDRTRHEFEAAVDAFLARFTSGSAPTAEEQASNEGDGGTSPDYTRTDNPTGSFDPGAGGTTGPLPPEGDGPANDRSNV